MFGPTFLQHCRYFVTRPLCKCTTQRVCYITNKSTKNPKVHSANFSTGRKAPGSKPFSSFLFHGFISKSIKNNLFFDFTAVRHVSAYQEKKRQRSVLIYICATGIFMVGMAYAGVPLYRMFCQSSGLGGQAVKGHDTSKLETMAPIKDRQLKIRFNADTASSMQWNFHPLQAEITVLPGETALAFYTAKNPTDKPIIGISTYNVVPFEAGQYFNKIQCFCFEEQRLNPNEEVDMPVFFYIDPEYSDDPKLEKIDIVTLSYTFFEAKEGLNIPVPSYATARH